LNKNTNYQVYSCNIHSVRLNAEKGRKVFSNYWNKSGY
jgi:hypothetical protein